MRLICRSFELPNNRIRPVDTPSEREVIASVVLSQISLSSSIAGIALTVEIGCFRNSRISVKSYNSPVEPVKVVGNTPKRALGSRRAEVAGSVHQPKRRRHLNRTA